VGVFFAWFLFLGSLKFLKIGAPAGGVYI
jgi:hypothetical protein